MKKIKYFLIIFILFLFPVYVNAASVSLKSNASTIVKGGSATVTATISDSKAIFFTEGTLSCSGAGVSKSANMSWDNTDNSKKSKSFSITITANESGTITCKTIGVKYTGGSSGSWTSLGNKTITIKVRTKSTNNNLKSLSVEGYTLSPSFNKNTLEYTVNLESNIETIKINASKEDGYASISGTGEKQVQEGDNKFEIKVTSEIGSSKVYTVNAVVKDSNPIVKQINGKNYTVIKRGSAITKPEFFTESTVKMNELEIPAFYNETTNITLIGLKDENGSIYLYKYDAKTDNLTKYESLTSVSKTIIFENNNEQVEDFTKTTITIDNVEYSAYQHETNKDYVLIYGMDIETGEKDWYLYNVKEKSIQTYISDIIDPMKEEFNKTLEEYKMVILGMAGLSLILLLIIIIQITSKNKMKRKLLKKLQTKQENNESKKKEESKKDLEEKKIEEEKIKPEKKKNNN